MTGLQSIRRHLCAWLAVVFCVWPFAANAAEFIAHRAWLEDPSGTLTFPQVALREQAFQPYTGVLTKGYTASTYWIRLRIDPAPEEKLILRIRPSYIDHIELYDPLDHPGGDITPRLSGDRYAKQLNDYVSLNHGFSIKGSANPRDVYLRVQSSSTMMIYPEVLAVTEASAADHRQELFYSIYLGVLTAMIIWALLQWLASRDMLIATFLVKQVVVVAHAVVIQGYLPLAFGEWLPASVMDQITSALVLGYIFWGAFFMLLLIHEYKPVRWLWRLFASLLLFYLPLVVMLWQGQARLAVHLNMLIGTIYAFGFPLLAISAQGWRQPGVPPPLPRWLLIIFTLAILFTAYASGLPSLGSIDAAEWNLNAPMFVGFITSMLMAVLLSLRARNIEKHRQQTLLDLALAEQEANNERHQREEQERFLAMLTHELKTPLGVARISLGASKLSGPQRDRIKRALANINAIVDRCRITDQLEHRQLLPQTETCDLLALVDDCIAAGNDPERVQVLERIPAPIESDSQLLAICLANLIDNALKYSPPTSRITVRVRQQEAAAGVSVDGFAVDICNRIGPAGTPDPEQIFSKYYRSRGALSKSGSGLGLYLTRSIAQLLGGQLSYQVDGDQVEFSLWIPA